MTDAINQPSDSPAATTSSPTPATPATTPEAPTPSLVNQQPPAAAPAATEFVPLEASAFTMPQGFTIDDESMTSFLGIMNNRELSPQAQAQALIELQANLTTKSSEAGSQAWKDTLAGWEQEVVNDPALGGANLQTTMANVGRVMDKFADENVRAAFDQTGAGWNPHIVRFLNELGKQFAEATPTSPGSPTNTKDTPIHDRIFGAKAS